jgi:hypothetical protein
MPRKVGSSATSMNQVKGRPLIVTNVTFDIYISIKILLTNLHKKKIRVFPCQFIARTSLCKLIL